MGKKAKVSPGALLFPEEPGISRLPEDPGKQAGAPGVPRDSPEEQHCPSPMQGVCQLSIQSSEEQNCTFQNAGPAR